MIQYPQWGYELRRQVWQSPGEDTGKEIELISAYAYPGGLYIGSREFAEYLCRERGIEPEAAGKDDNICSVGFCAKDQKWYGWSHRAICGFKIGDMLFDPEWESSDPKLPTDEVPFILSGSVQIETPEQARQAAVNFARR